MYDADDSIWVGELTLYSWSGLTPFTPDEADKLVGSYWSLQRPARRALNAMLSRWRQIPSARRGIKVRRADGARRLVRLSRTSIADELHEEHTRRVRAE